MPDERNRLNHNFGGEVDPPEVVITPCDADRAASAGLVLAPTAPRRRKARSSRNDKAPSGGKSQAKPAGNNKAVELKDFKPWDAPVNGAELLGDISQAIAARISMDPREADMLALWGMHTHGFEIFDTTPRLLLDAPGPEVAKTELSWHTLGHMVPRAYPTMHPTPATFFRLITQGQPTFLLDESDQWYNPQSDITQAINAGWEPGGRVPRCEGENNDVRDYFVHAPVVISGVNLGQKLRTTTLSRCIVVKLKRATQDEIRALKRATRIGHHDSELHDLGRKAARWMHDNRDLIKAQRRSDKLSRNEAKWESLHQIANVAGGDWPQRCERAYTYLTGELPPTLGEQLLSHTREAFGNETRIHTKSLREFLCSKPEWPWADFNPDAAEDTGIRDRQIANLLEPYQIKPRNVKVSGEQGHGYKREDFEDAWRRYL